MKIKRPSVAAARHWAVSSCCLLTSVLTPLHAEELPDPTRPPASVFAPSGGTGEGRNAAGNQSSGLHTIIISDTRRAAIIDGKTVELGGAHGDAMLVEVSEGGVVLQHAKSRQVLTLFPGVKMTRKETSERESAEPGKESVEPGKESVEPGKESVEPGKESVEKE